jgi:hypothetical protein
LYANGGYSKKLELIETPTFSRQIAAIFGHDEAYREFQLCLAERPEVGPLIKGGGGIRKVRVGTGSRGKSGGARVIYYWAARRDIILLLYAYSKKVAADLTPKQVSELARTVKEELEQ